MIEINPAILAHSEEEFVRKVDRVKPLGKMLHIDVMDGVFIGNISWAPPQRMRKLLAGASFEAHLMVSDPKRAVREWFAAGADRVIFHVETVNHGQITALAVGARSGDLCVALNPKTPLALIEPYMAQYDCVTIMGVHPGWSGQELQETTFEKIAALRRGRPLLKIQVDGGVRPENARRLAEAGANVLIAGSALTDADDPAAALKKFMLSLQ